VDDEVMRSVGNEIRLRISSALIIIAIIFVPFSHFGIRPIWFPSKFGLLHNLFSWLYYDLPPILFFIAFILALVFGLVLAYHRKWKGALQCLFEVGVCFAGVLFAPAY
jgi:hypothetical protein